MRLATRVAAQSLNDIEVPRPTTIWSANTFASGYRAPNRANRLHFAASVQIVDLP